MPDEVPKTWSLSPLNDLIEFSLGGDWGNAPDTNQPDYVSVRCLRSSEVKNWSVEKGRTAALRKIKESSLAKRRLSSGDIIVEVSGGGPEQPVGRTLLIDDSVIAKNPNTPKVCTNFFRLIRPNREIDSSYLNWFLRFFYESGQTQPLQGGSNNLRNLKFREYLQITIPVPPTGEQRRIVAKIDELFSELADSVANLEAARTRIRTYRQSLLEHAFEGRLTEQWRNSARSAGDLTPVNQMLKSIDEIPRPNRWNSRSRDVILGHPCLAVGNPGTPLPAGWQWVQLADVARMESGHTPSRRHPEWWNGDIPWIGIADAKENNGRVISETKQHTNSDGLENSAARLLPKGTVCISRTASVGYVVEMGTEMATSQDFVNWVPSRAVTAAWLRLVFGANKEYLLRFGKGTTHRTIYFPEWLSIHIGLPPIEEQRQIVDEVESKLSELDAMDASVQHAATQTGTLRQSILKRAFKGDLVRQDPHDEPASTLLARIRDEAQENVRAAGGSAGTQAEADA